MEPAARGLENDQSINQSVISAPSPAKMTNYSFCKLCKNNLISCSCFYNINNNGTYVMPASEARPGSSGPAITTQAPNIKLIKSKHGAHPGKSDATPNVLGL